MSLGFSRSDEVSSSCLRFAHDQVLTMSALINCVELKESADNCAAMADIAVRLPPARAAGEGMFGGDRRKQQQPGLGGGISTPRCLAPEFLAELLVRCTRSFAHQLKTDRSDGDGEEGGVAASPAPARVQQPGRGTTGYKPARGGAADSSTALTTAPGVEPAAPATPATPQAGDNAEQSMSHAEGTDLVLGGHCALLLGLLVRGQERNRCGQRRRKPANGTAPVQQCVEQPRVATFFLPCCVAR